VEVSKHFDGAPAADKTDDVGIDACAEKGHGAASSKTAGGDTKRVDAKLEVSGSSAMYGRVWRK
jgi:hypothetical protein